MSATAKKLELLEERIKVQAGLERTVYGFVCPDKGFTHAITQIDGKWEETHEEPDLYLAAKLEPVVKSNKRFIIVIGGRGSSKSVGVGDICLADAKDNGAKTYCLREFQSSIKNSVHSLLKEEIKRLQFEGFDVQNTSILKNGKEVFEFAGLARNVDSIKSSHGFKRYTVEEAQFLSEHSLKELTPTARKKPKKGLPGEQDEYEDDDNVSIIFIANPGSSEDPFSKRFLTPFQYDIDKHGFYEDDLHLIVVLNYTDNPWFNESGLEKERQWDFENRSRAYYDHVWRGHYNDSVEDALIMAEWFDACIDAHKKLGFEPKGAKIASHDPSDMGEDAKGYAMRHGSVFLDIQEKDSGDVNEGGHWAAGLANSQGVDYFSWDADGMGCALGEQMSVDFNGKSTRLNAFKGSESPDNPEAIYKPALKSPVSQQIKIKDALKNKRAQYYSKLRDRCYRTYRAVVHDEYHDPDTLISFDSSIALLGKLRAEVCRLPLKPNGNGLIELYTKPEMKNKFKLPSPNLGDSVMMTLRFKPQQRAPVRRPKPLRPMGIK